MPGNAGRQRRRRIPVAPGACRGTAPAARHGPRVEGILSKSARSGVCVARTLIGWWLALALAAPAAAGTELLLLDGRTIDAANVRRDGDVYLIDLADGSTISLPVGVVARVSLTDERAEARPEKAAGLTYDGPRQLAGPEIAPIGPDRALEQVGAPSRFARDIIDPSWSPQSAFPEGDVLEGGRSTWSVGVIDPFWQPVSGLAERDVLAGSRSVWSESPVDSTWVPEDGFRLKQAFWDPDALLEPQSPPVAATTARELAPTTAGSLDADVADASRWFRGSTVDGDPGVQFRFRVPSSARGSSSEVRACARNVLPAAAVDSKVDVEPIEDTRYASLPIELFGVRTGDRDDARRAVFTVEGGTCRPISGDLRDPLGIELSRSHVEGQGVDAFNAAIAELDVRAPQTDEEKIEYVFAVVSLIDPAVAGRDRASLVLLEDADLLESLAARAPASCAVAPSKRERAASKAVRRVRPPRVVHGQGRTVVELFTWSDAGGEVVRHRVRLEPSGRVEIDRDTIESHVGDHVDLP